MKRGKKGFTMIEMMLVIAVMAVLAALTIGGVMQMIKGTREKRINTMCETLRLGLITYRTQNGKWPTALDPDDDGRTKVDNVSFFGERNWKVFGPLIPTKDAKKEHGYISTAEYLTKPMGRGVMPLQKAIDEECSIMPLGYANPENTSNFRYFRVTFNLVTDTVHVSAKWRCGSHNGKDCGKVLPCPEHGEDGDE